MTTGDFPHTATTSWSGFVYQGKVAIYHVLQLMETHAACADFVLQLDSLEDFAILDGAEAVISMHQVKAKKTQSYSAYKEDFIKLRKKARDAGCTDASFHLAREINDKSEENILTDHSPVTIYHYDGVCCCNVDEIDQKIEKKLQALLVTLWPDDGSKQKVEYARKARSYLDQLVLKKLLATHKMIHDGIAPQNKVAYKQTIPFIEFKDILSEDLNQKDQGEEYYLYVLMGDIHRYYQHYCIESEGVISEDELKKLSNCMKKIGEIDIIKMKQFIRNIIPHREFKIQNLSDYHDHTFSPEEFQDTFLTILQYLKQPDYNPKNFFNWVAKGKSFVPTTISCAPPNTLKVCINIIKNAKQTDLDIMFEGNNLITLGIDVESIMDKVTEVVRTPAEEEDNDNMHHITRWKKVTLISLENAKEVINV